MVKIFNTEVHGLERSVKAIENSYKIDIDSLQEPTERNWEVAKTLGNNPPGLAHDAYLKGITVYFDIIYSQYWTPEFQRYSFIQVIMSSSKIHSLIKALKKDDCNRLFNKYVDDDSIEKVKGYALKYNEEKDPEQKYFWYMKCLSNLPMGYELQMTVTTNYLQLKTIFLQRKNHKLKEDWGEFCNWCLTLPHFSELTGCKFDG